MGHSHEQMEKVEKRTTGEYLVSSQSYVEPKNDYKVYPNHRRGINSQYILEC